jgi:hypothetical protein
MSVRYRMGRWGLAGLALAMGSLLFLPFVLYGPKLARAQGPSGTFMGIPFGTALPPSCAPGSSTPYNPFFYLTTVSGANAPGLYPCNASGLYGPAGAALGSVQYVFVAANFTTANATTLQNITGLSWTMPANAALNVPFSCHLAYSQATGAASDAFGIQDSVAPTNIFATGALNTNTTATTQGNLATLTTTTATAIVTATPNATATTYNADLNGLVQQPSGSAGTININVSTATGADAITVYQGSFCRIG